MTRAITIYRSMRVMELLGTRSLLCRILKSFGPAVCALVSTPRRAAKNPNWQRLTYSPAEAGRSSGRRLAARSYHPSRRLSVRYQTLPAMCR